MDVALFPSEADSAARFVAAYEQFVTIRPIVQPRIESELATPDVPEIGGASELSSVEAGLRLRCEIEREFARDAGARCERRLIDLADSGRARRDEVGDWAALFGVRSWLRACARTIAPRRHTDGR